MKTVLKMFVVLLIAVLLAGCGHPHSWWQVKSDMCPSECPKDGIAVVKGDGHLIGLPFTRSQSLAAIHMVDNEVVKIDVPHDIFGIPMISFPDADLVRVFPGPHEIVIRITKWCRPFCWWPASCPEELTGSRLLIFNLDAQPGHTYKVDIPTFWKKNSVIKIVDEGTEEVVASQVNDYYTEHQKQMPMVIG